MIQPSPYIVLLPHSTKYYYESFPYLLDKGAFSFSVREPLTLQALSFFFNVLPTRIGVQSRIFNSYLPFEFGASELYILKVCTV